MEMPVSDMQRYSPARDLLLLVAGIFSSMFLATIAMACMVPVMRVIGFEAPEEQFLVSLMRAGAFAAPL
jgi:hypothetical protein